MSGNAPAKSKYSCDMNNNGTAKNQTYVNTTLGWLLGFRRHVVSVYASTTTPPNVVVADTLPDLYGPKTFVICLDDFQNNCINTDLVGISRQSYKLKLPSYYSPDLLYECSPPPTTTTTGGGTAAAAAALLAAAAAASSGGAATTDPSTLMSLLSAGSAGTQLVKPAYNPRYRSLPLVNPQSPRVLTNSQLYSINEILKNNAQTVDYRPKFAKHTNTLATIPIKLGGNSALGDVYTEFGGSMQDNKRSYFGPVKLSRLRLRLYDDMGDLVDLNGADWTLLMICDQLYQY